jgi:hypothetical protein
VKAKIRFVKFEKALAMQVLEMDERFRNGSNYCCKNGFTIVSDAYPELGYKTICMRGHSSRDDLVIANRTFISNSNRDEMLAEYIAALKDWAENWKGFKGTAETPAASGDDIVVEV